MKMYLSQLYQTIGGAALSVPSFIGSKVIMVDILVSLSTAFIYGFLSNFV